MSGAVIYQPPRKHRCGPGWRWHPDPDGSGRRLGDPPWARDFPKGTVWQCNDCGCLWISLGTRNAGGGGPADFRRVGWLERKLRRWARA